MVDVHGGPAYQQQLNYGAQPGFVNQPVGLNQTMNVGGGIAPAPQMPPGLPPNASYVGAIQDPTTGSVIDRYAIPQRGVIPVRTVVPEVQEYQVYGQTMVPETQYVQVPVQRMVPKTIMVPETTMTTQAVTVQKPVGVVQNRQRTIQKVIEGQKIIESQQILQYERPRVQVIPGRMLGAQQLGVQQVGVQWNRAYYDQTAQAPAQNMVVNQAMINPAQYQTIAAPIGVGQQQQYATIPGAQAGQFVGGGQPVGQYLGGGQPVGGVQYLGGGQPVGGGQYLGGPASPALGPYGGGPVAY